MPLPQIVAPASAAAVGRHVFVSYSHKDAELAEPFMRTLCALAGNLPELGLAPERIFYDRNKLKAGDDWDDSIKSHLQRADLFLLLVSSNSLTSRYCLNEELSGAAALGITIVPVLLTDVPLWKHRPVEGDPRGRRLGAFNAVPVNGKWGEQPIRGGNWQARETALTQAVEQIAARLQRDDAPLLAAAGRGGASGAGNASTSAPRRVLPPLLTNLCNQQPPETSFEAGLDGWTADRALLVLVKGEYADDTPGFWDRLLAKNLAGFCEDANLTLGPPKSFDLPRAGEVGAAAADVALAVRRNLSSALFGNARRMRSGADLALLLAADANVLPLVASLPEQPRADAALVLGALLALVDEMPAGAPLRRLVLAVLVEGPSLLAEPQLAEALGLRGAAAQTHVVETRRLQPLTREDVALWHRRYTLRSVLQLDEAQLVDRLFQRAETLRQRPFDQQVRPLLAQAAPES